MNEIIELERQGVDIGILSLRKPTDGYFHESISRVSGKVEYTPELFAESRMKILKAHGQWSSKSPRGYGRAFSEMLRHKGIDSVDFLQAPMALLWAAKRKFEHVHIHFGTHEASVAYLAHLIGGLSYSLTLHAFDIFRDNVDRVLLARKINASRFTVTVSEYNRNFMVKNLPGVIPEKIRVNYNGIDGELFRDEGLEREPNSILSVGRLIEKKGFADLIQAVGRLRDAGVVAKCTIVGDGREKANLKSLISKLKLKDSVKLAGSLSQDRVRELMNRSACLALPCVQAKDGNIDALPTVLLEAMACGCPCVSTILSGVPEIIEDRRSGLLVEPGDVVALSDAIGKMLGDADARRGFAAEGRIRVEKLFDVRTNVDRMRGWFSETRAASSATEGASKRAGAVAGQGNTNPTECAM